MSKRHEEYQYLDLLTDILENGIRKPNRTGIDTIALFGAQMKFDLTKGFPLLTTKKVYFKAVVHELLWLISGNTNIKYLKDNEIRIWNEWADENGNLGPVYGHQWRNFGEGYVIENLKEGGSEAVASIDQLANAIETIKKDPNNRRIIVTAWNPIDIPKMRLPPCHMMFQFNVDTVKGELCCHLYQRSCDQFLGIPMNIASYALLTHMVAQVCGLKAGQFIHTLNDAHIYVNHIDQIKEQLSREPFPFPQIELNKLITNIDDFKYEDVNLIDYKSHPSIKAQVAV